jgi:Predicted membrane protein/domain
MTEAGIQTHDPKAAADSRIAATLLDIFVILMALPAGDAVGRILSLVGLPWFGAVVAALVSWVLIAISAFAAFEASPLRATPGKLACGLAVVRSDGERASFREAFRRNMAKYGLGIAGLAIAARSGWTPDGCHHDRIAGTKVVPRKGSLE